MSQVHKQAPGELEAAQREKLSRRLEESFFLNQDKNLIEKLKAMHQMKDAKKALSKASGIANDKILSTLVELEIRPEILASLTLLPLIEVAWADGEIDSQEKKAILLAASKTRFAKGSVNYDLLKQWIDHKPTPRLFSAWFEYIQGICESLSEKEIRELKNEIMNHTREIAKASGGFLGMGIGEMISDAEKAMLNKLEGAFHTEKKKKERPGGLQDRRKGER
jgi:hypothetical protein